MLMLHASATQTIVLIQRFYLKVSAYGAGKCKMQMLHASATDKPVPVAETELVLHHRQCCDVEL